MQIMTCMHQYCIVNVVEAYVPIIAFKFARLWLT